MTGKHRILLSLLLIVLLAGCGKADGSDTLTIEGHDWTSAQAIDSAGQPLDLPTLTCTAQDGALSVMGADGNTQSGTYSLAQRDTNSALYDLSLDGESGTVTQTITYGDWDEASQSWTPNGEEENFEYPFTLVNGHAVFSAFPYPY